SNSTINSMLKLVSEFALTVILQIDQTTIAMRITIAALLLVAAAATVLVDPVTARVGLRRFLRLRDIWRSRRDISCRSQLTISIKTLRQCVKGQCKPMTNRKQRISCKVNCFHWFLLGTQQRGEAYNSLVQKAGCDTKRIRKMRRCRRDAVKTAAGAQLELSQLQKYNVLVCQLQCPGGLPAAVCTANCQLSQLVGAEAYKKFSDCFAKKACAQKSEGAELDSCRRQCLNKC
ncbi:hypothetical protein BOX15_Mlig010135g1, partial [Macrostomum lignano]